MPLQILITKDGATKIPKEVADLDEAKTFADAGFHVDVETENGRMPLDTLLADPDAANAPAAEVDPTKPTVIGSIVNAVTSIFGGNPQA